MKNTIPKFKLLGWLLTCRNPVSMCFILSSIFICLRFQNVARSSCYLMCISSSFDVGAQVKSDSALPGVETLDPEKMLTHSKLFTRELIIAQEAFPKCKTLNGASHLWQFYVFRFMGAELCLWLWRSQELQWWIVFCIAKASCRENIQSINWWYNSIFFCKDLCLWRCNFVIDGIQ